MDDQRYQELLHKRDRVGLSDEDATELGRMHEASSQASRGRRRVHREVWNAAGGE